MNSMNKSVSAKGQSKCSGREQDGQLDVPPRPPNHVAVIMDGHRRFGRVKYGDPLKVSRVAGVPVLAMSLRG